MDDAKIEEFKKIYAELEAEINKLVSDFWTQKQAQISKAIQQIQPPPTVGTPQVATTTPMGQSQGVGGNKSLPWFTNGIRTFLRKLWHGDSKDNPDWQDMPAWKWKKVEHISISEYNSIRNELEGVFNEYAGDPDTRILISKIMISIRRALAKVSKVDNTIGQSTPETKPEVQPEPESQAQVEPVSKPEEPENISTPEPENKTIPPQVNVPTGDSSVSPIKTGGNVTKRKSKAKTKPASVSMEEKIENASFEILNTIEKIDALPDKDLRTKSDQKQYIDLKNKMKSLLSGVGIAMTNSGQISKSKFKNAVPILVAIMRSIDKSGKSHLNWVNAYNYKLFPIEGDQKQIDMIQKYIDSMYFKSGDVHFSADEEPTNTAAQSAEEPQLAHKINAYDGLPLSEKTNFLRQMMHENNEHYDKIIKSRQAKSIQEKLEMLKF